MEIREIGIEKEMFLLQNETICEPLIYGFPADEMGFLVELRSLPSDRAYPVITTLFQEELQYQLRANKFNMALHAKPFMYANKAFVNHIQDTYKILDFPDYTQNIYGHKSSHHLGIFPEGHNNYKLTAGVHIHFSSRDASNGRIIELPIEKIVKEMDATFAADIERSGRIPGEWEPKKHGGFEYRSLPCDMDITIIIKEAFKILRNTN